MTNKLKELISKAQETGDFSQHHPLIQFNEGLTLENILYQWWDDTFTKKETSLQELVDKIEEWLPKEQFANSQNAYVECTVEGFNDCLNKIKRKLR